MIFPQTSHFDDLQKHKGKRLPCGVFPFVEVFVLFRTFIFPRDLERRAWRGRRTDPRGRGARRTLSRRTAPARRSTDPQRPRCWPAGISRGSAHRRPCRLCRSAHRRTTSESPRWAAPASGCTAAADTPHGGANSAFPAARG